MQIDFERTGGFGGMRVAASFDLEEMPQDDSAKVRDLLHQCHFHQLPERIASEGALPDQFTYKITARTNSGTHSVTTGDASAPAELRALIDLLTELARARRSD